MLIINKTKKQNKISSNDISSDYIKYILLSSNTDLFFDLCKLTNNSPLLYKLLDQNMAEIEANRAGYDLTDDIHFYNVVYTHSMLRQHLLETHLHYILAEANAGLFAQLLEANAFNNLTLEHCDTMLRDAWSLVELEMDSSFLDNVSHYADCKTLYGYVQKIIKHHFSAPSIGELVDVQWLAIN